MVHIVKLHYQNDVFLYYVSPTAWFLQGLTDKILKLETFKKFHNDYSTTFGLILGKETTSIIFSFSSVFTYIYPYEWDHVTQKSISTISEYEFNSDMKKKENIHYHSIAQSTMTVPFLCLKYLLQLKGYWWPKQYQYL